MTLENWRSTTGRVCPEQVRGMARGVDAMDIVFYRQGMTGEKRGRWVKKREKKVKKKRIKRKGEGQETMCARRRLGGTEGTKGQGKGETGEEAI